MKNQNGQTHFPTTLRPALQQDWDIRGTGNFVFGGTGTGLIITLAILSFFDVSGRWLILLALAFVGLGLTCVLAKIGRPFRAMNVVLNPHTSWMTREGLIAGPLFATGLAAAWFDMPFVTGIAAIVAVVFLYCQGQILVASKGIPAWRTPTILPLIMATGMVEGASLFMIVGFFMGIGDMATKVALGVLLVSIAARIMTWRKYRNTLKEEGAPTKTLKALEGAEGFVNYLGHLIPVVMLLGSQFMVEGGPVVGMLAAFLPFLSGWFMKYIIVNKAAFNQGFAIPHTPARGGGKPGPGTKPGWTMREL
jgi:phenylacetyl-CoA:acceptor oxidoreductase subunit 2